ncbi:MAG: hypothetical protein LBI69_04210 [Puniceicoccales bacterium]|nr:hypothetical protein [Puniceicoccales bacterium]
MSTKSISGGQRVLTPNLPNDIDEKKLSKEKEKIAENESPANEPPANSDNEVKNVAEQSPSSINSSPVSVNDAKRPDLRKIHGDGDDAFKILQSGVPPEELPPELGAEMGNLILKV